MYSDEDGPSKTPVFGQNFTDGTDKADFEWDGALLNPSRGLFGRIRAGFKSARGFWWASNICQLFVILILASMVLRKTPTEPEEPTEMTADLSTLIPNFSRKTVNFQPDYKFSGNLLHEGFTDEVLDHWKVMMPRGYGFLKVDNPEDHPYLSTPFTIFNTTGYFSSVVHQLHCLHAIMVSYNAALHPEKMNEKMHSTHSWHVGHCFDYLRQVILCHGDTSLEGVATTFPPGVIGSDGWNVNHECRDYREIYTWLESKRLTEARWI